MLLAGKFFLDIGSEVPAFLCECVGLEIDVSKVTDDSREWVNHQPTLFVSRSALKQHTSTMVHFSLNVNYIAQQASSQRNISQPFLLCCCITVIDEGSTAST